jgi:voltage-gated potassium channel
MTSKRDDKRRLAWETRTRVPFLLLAFLYLVAWTVVAVDPRLLSPLSIIAGILLLLIWLTFIVDYVVRLRLAADRGKFFISSLPDLLAAILPSLRPLVQLRHLTGIRFLARRTGQAQRARIAIFAVAFAVVFIYSIALAVLVAERGADGAVILTLGDAIWWACVTIFTVGYGDLYPVTPIGRIWAVVLMVGGVGIIGAASAIFVSYLNDRIRHVPENAPAEVHTPTLDPPPEETEDAAPEGTASS